MTDAAVPAGRKAPGPMIRAVMRHGARFLPFADAASADLPLGRLLRLGLFQVSVGMALVLLNGTLNRVMIVELGVPSALVAAMVSLPVLFAPLRALVGFRSDIHKSVLGWRRVPYLFFGTMLQFGGFAIMPFALLLLSGDTTGPMWVGQASAALAFFLVGAGLHTTQTAGLALANDLAPEHARPRVVALLYVMLLIGMVGSAFVFGRLLPSFDAIRLIQVIQGAAAVTMILNVIAAWKQEVRNPALTDPRRPRPSFADSWRRYRNAGRTVRVLAAVGVGTAAFAMQDILLEPYGAQVLGLSVGETTTLTALMAGGTLLAFGISARRLKHDADPFRLAAAGALIGAFAFAAVLFASPLGSADLFRVGAALIGFSAGLFAVGTLTACMALARDGESGLALGAWGAVQATCAGVGVALGGLLRDGVGDLAAAGSLGPALTDPVVGYGTVYLIEITLLFTTLVVVGPLVRRVSRATPTRPERFGLAEFPG